MGHEFTSDPFLSQVHTMRKLRDPYTTVLLKSYYVAYCNSVISSRSPNNSSISQGQVLPLILSLYTYRLTRSWSMMWWSLHYLQVWSWRYTFITNHVISLHWDYWSLHTCSSDLTYKNFFLFNSITQPVTMQCIISSHSKEECLQT